MTAFPCCTAHLTTDHLESRPGAWISTIAFEGHIECWPWLKHPRKDPSEWPMVGLVAEQASKGPG